MFLRPASTTPSQEEAPAAAFASAALRGNVVEQDGKILKKTTPAHDETSRLPYQQDVEAGEQHGSRSAVCTSRVLRFPLSKQDPWQKEKLELLNKIEQEEKENESFPLQSCHSVKNILVQYEEKKETVVVTISLAGGCGGRGDLVLAAQNDHGDHNVDEKVQQHDQAESSTGGGATETASRETTTTTQDLNLFELLLRIADILTQNVHDLYFEETRDPRRGLFLLHKLSFIDGTLELLEPEKKDLLAKIQEYCDGVLTNASSTWSGAAFHSPTASGAAAAAPGSLHQSDVATPSSTTASTVNMLSMGDTKDHVASCVQLLSEKLFDVESLTTTTCTTSTPSTSTSCQDIDETHKNCRIGNNFLHPNLQVGNSKVSGDGLYVKGNTDGLRCNDTILKISATHILNAVTAFRDAAFRKYYHLLRLEQCDEEHIAMAYLIYLRKRFDMEAAAGGGGVNAGVVEGTDKELSEEVKKAGGENLLSTNSAGRRGARTSAYSSSHPLHYLIHNNLPQTLDDCPPTLLQWPEEALENLYCPQVIFQVEAQRMEVNEFYRSLSQVVFNYEKHKQIHEDFKQNAQNENCVGSSPSSCILGEEVGDHAADKMNVDGDDDENHASEIFIAGQQDGEIGTTSTRAGGPRPATWVQEEIPRCDRIPEVTFEDVLYAKVVFDSRAFQIDFKVCQKTHRPRQESESADENFSAEDEQEHEGEQNQDQEDAEMQLNSSTESTFTADGDGGAMEIEAHQKGDEHQGEAGAYAQQEVALQQQAAMDTTSMAICSSSTSCSAEELRKDEKTMTFAKPASSSCSAQGDVNRHDPPSCADEDSSDHSGDEVEGDELQNTCGAGEAASSSEDTKPQYIDGEWFPFSKVTCLVPFADYLNHDRSSPICVPRFEADKTCRAGKQEDGNLSCRSTKTSPSLGHFILQTAANVVPARPATTTSEPTSTTKNLQTETPISCPLPPKQLCLNYGPLQNWELLQYYGFCFDRNPADTLQLDLGEPEDAEVQLLLHMHNVTTSHVLSHIVPTTSNRTGTALIATSTSSSTSCPEQAAVPWPLSKKLLICLRILHGIDSEDLQNSLFEKNEARCAADLQIVETLKDVLNELLTPADSVLHESVMTPTNKIWESHEQFGVLAQKFRESQRMLVMSNLTALEDFEQECLRVMTKRGSTGSAKSNKGSGASTSTSSTGGARGAGDRSAGAASVPGDGNKQTENTTSTSNGPAGKRRKRQRR
ncbi:unnamed protein product [Amoebophrya sp. A120]|nr:unnamed protein product [Amoebophrya sp. A120]|eukprot:GSA120T00008830001.1